jgi:hypothetical protein
MSWSGRCVSHEIGRDFPCFGGPSTTNDLRRAGGIARAPRSSATPSHPRHRRLGAGTGVGGARSRRAGIEGGRSRRATPLSAAPTRRTPRLDRPAVGGDGPRPAGGDRRSGCSCGAGAAGRASRVPRGRDPARRWCDYPVRDPALPAPPGSPRAGHGAGARGPHRGAPSPAGGPERYVAGSVCRVGDSTRQVGGPAVPGVARPICTRAR